MNPSPDRREVFQSVFSRLREIFAGYACEAVVMSDSADRYYLSSHEVRARDGYRTGFGGVEIRKSYVSAHLIPVYGHPDLLLGISADLRRRMQGKSCFNFRKEDETLFAEFAGLVEAGVRRFRSEDRLRSPITPQA
ncbi:hypothetical protein BH09PSE1_BH09PSE1_23150 [soil metagenome]